MACEKSLGNEQFIDNKDGGVIAVNEYESVDENHSKTVMCDTK